MRFIKLFPVVVVILIVAASVGCVGPCRQLFGGVTPTPVITPTATVVPTPTLPAVNNTIERQYNYVDKLNAGINEYNAGIAYLGTAQGYYNRSQQTNNSSLLKDASQAILTGKIHMDNARQQFIGMEQFALTPDEINLSNRYNATAYYYGVSFQYMSDMYKEDLNQSTRTPPNWVLQRFYAEQAKYFNSLAHESFAQAKEIESRIPFLR